MEDKLAIIGLGYVGLPLAVEFSKHYKVVGYDISHERIANLKLHNDITNEVSERELINADIEFGSDECLLKEANIFIVTVPTPINNDMQPDFNPLIQASQIIGRALKAGDLVIYESTVYPGATEEICIPILAAESSLEFNKDFKVGYSPERINPGDKNNKLTSIKKVISGGDNVTLSKVESLYEKIISAGLFKASSIKVAEASKVVENIQRDVNIALVNELHQLFTYINIPTEEVISAASTKWNFMTVYPGIVGGHCISVDPYYLIKKAQQNGYVPDLIRTAREINESMSNFFVSDFIKFLLKKKINPINLKINFLGVTFKEDCPDIRNSKAIDIYRILQSFGIQPTIYDPVVNEHELMQRHGLSIEPLENINLKLVTILIVRHSKFLNLLENQQSMIVYELSKR